MNTKSFIIGLGFALTFVAFGSGYWLGQRNADTSLQHLNSILIDHDFHQTREIRALKAQQPQVDPFGGPL